LAMAVPIWAQFAELAASDDGRQFYFTSPLVLGAVSPTRAESRIYRLAPEGIQLPSKIPGPLHLQLLSPY